MHIENWGLRMSSKYFYALWELTKRELSRKYARSYLGIAWSSLYPLLRMLLVVFMFSHILYKPIDRYPVYYFTGFLIYEFINVAVSTSVTTLRDNKNLIVKSKLPRQIFVLSRVYTAFVNFLLGSLPFLVVLIIYRVRFTFLVFFVLVDIFFLAMFVIGLAYFVSILYVKVKDTKNVVIQGLMIMRYFVALYYLPEWLSPGVEKFINLNPPYIYIKVARDCIMFGRLSESRYLFMMIGYAVLMYLVGKIYFVINKDDVLARL